MAAALLMRAIKTPAELGLADTYSAARQHLPGGARTAMARAAAFNTFDAGGLPNSHNEAWKYTDLRRLMLDAKPLAPAPAAPERSRARGAGALFSELHAPRIVV